MQPLPFYKSRAWLGARAQALHDAGYLCQGCGTTLVAKGRAAHVHHRKPYATTPALQTEPLNLKALCRSCHNAEHHAMRRGHAMGCDADGNPTDANHPWNKVELKK